MAVISHRPRRGGVNCPLFHTVPSFFAGCEKYGCELTRRGTGLLKLTR